MKMCNRCGVEKPRSEFHKNRNTKDGLTTPCKSCKKEYRRDYTLSKWGITLQEFDAMASDGCGICGTKTCDSGRELAVDHCHETGKVRGVLCRTCNQALGKLGDNLEGITKVMRYLQQYAT